jgi:hypothetical protein
MSNPLKIVPFPAAVTKVEVLITVANGTVESQVIARTPEARDKAIAGLCALRDRIARGLKQT